MMIGQIQKTPMRILCKYPGVDPCIIQIGFQFIVRKLGLAAKKKLHAFLGIISWLMFC